MPAASMTLSATADRESAKIITQHRLPLKLIFSAHSKWDVLKHKPNVEIFSCSEAFKVK